MTVQSVQANAGQLGFNPVSSGQYQPPPPGMNPAIWATGSTEGLQAYLDPLMNPQSGLPTSNDNWALMQAQIQAAEKMAMDAQKGGVIHEAENTFARKTMRYGAYMSDQRYRQAMANGDLLPGGRASSLGQVLNVGNKKQTLKGLTRETWWKTAKSNLETFGQANEFTANKPVWQYIKENPREFSGQIADDIKDPFIRGGGFAKLAAGLYIAVSAWDVLSGTYQTFKQSRANHEGLIHTTLKSAWTFGAKSAKWFALWGIGSAAFSLGMGLVCVGGPVGFIAGAVASIAACIVAEKLGGFLKNTAKSLIPG